MATSPVVKLVVIQSLENCNKEQLLHLRPMYKELVEFHTDVLEAINLKLKELGVRIEDDAESSEARHGDVKKPA